MPTLNPGETTEIYYELIEGAADQPVLVFLHEGLGSTAMWKDFPRALCAATGHPGLVYDRKGYGLSAPLAGSRGLHYLHEYALRELRQVVDALLPGRDHWLIGHSDGGSIALIYAAERPAGLVGIITEAAHVFVEEVTLAGLRTALDAYAAGKLRGLSKYHGDKTDVLFHAWSDTWLADWFRGWNLEYLLQAIACPVLVMQGSEDQYATSAQVEAIGRAPRARALMVEGCGHAPHLEKPELVLGAMRQFIAGP